MNKSKKKDETEAGDADPGLGEAGLGDAGAGDAGDSDSFKVKHLKTDDSGIVEDGSLNLEDSSLSEDTSKVMYCICIV